MNVRITPRATPTRTELYSGIGRVESDGSVLHLVRVHRDREVGSIALGLSTVAEIAIDADGGNLPW